MLTYAGLEANIVALIGQNPEQSPLALPPCEGRCHMCVKHTQDPTEIVVVFQTTPGHTTAMFFTDFDEAWLVARHFYEERKNLV